MTARLHLPDEPLARLTEWRSLLGEGTAIDEVFGGPHGVIAWYWTRWSALERLGTHHDAFVEVAAGHRRELALWLRGERTHVATASGLLGRIERRCLNVAAHPAAA